MIGRFELITENPILYIWENIRLQKESKIKELSYQNQWMDVWYWCTRYFPPQALSRPVNRGVHNEHINQFLQL
jgi:hypothetical protein